MRNEIFSYDNDRLFSVNCIGYSEDTAVTRFGPGLRDLYIIHYVLSGSGYFNGQKVSDRQGFLITPGMSEYYYPDKDDPWSYLWVIFTDSDAEKLFESYHAAPETHIFDYGNKQALTKTVNLLTHNDKRRYTSAELFELFLSIFNDHDPVRRSHQRSADLYCDYAMNYIRFHLFRPITVEELTDLLGVTQPYLYHIFTEKYGISPKRYITDRKMSKAKQLLRETDLPICEVSASVGYPDALAFSRQFKKFVGCSPTDFRTR